MDRKKSKKIRDARVIATNTFMAISVVAIVFVLMLIAMGFSFNESGDLEQSGLVQISSRPSGATVEIDGNTQFSHTEINKMLSAGEHNIKITKSGYDSWETLLDVDAGLLTHIEWVRLFPLTPKTTQATTFNLPRHTSISPDHKSLIVFSEGSNSLSIFDLQNGTEAKSSSISLTKVFELEDSKSPIPGIVFIHGWNANNTKITVEWLNADKSNWYVIDLNDPSKSINLTKLYALPFDRILIANEAATKLWATSNENLYSIDTSNKTISSVLANNIIDISNNLDTVAFIDKTTSVCEVTPTEETSTETSCTPETTYNLKTYSDGEKKTSTVADLSESFTTEKTPRTRIVMGTYWGDEWIAYNIDNKAEILKGRYPSADKKESGTLKSIFNNILEFNPEVISKNNLDRIIAFSDSRSVITFDIENSRDYTITTDSDNPSINWLDSYIFAEKYNDNIIIRDFTGENRREIISQIDNDLPVFISANNKYLYYFSFAQKTEKTDTNTTPENETTDGQTEATTDSPDQYVEAYHLIREDLNI